MVEAPPRLDVLSELPHDGLNRSSTFRACLEKAVEDINNKYGASSTSCLPDSQTYETNNGDRVANGHPSLYHARSNFQPRYRLPTFVHVPLICAQPTVGEVKDISPCPSNETRRPSQTQGGSLFSERQIDEILGQAFETTDSPEKTAADEHPYDRQGHDDSLPEVSSSLAMPSSPPSVTTEENDPEPGGNEGSKLRTSGYSFTGQDTEGSDTQLAPSPDADSIPGAFPHGLADGIPSSSASAINTDTNNIHIQFQQKQPLPELDASSDFSILALKRIRRTPESSEACTRAESSESLTEAELVPLQRIRTQDDKPSTGTPEQRAPSVSELVSKFRRMASPPNDVRQEGAVKDGDAKIFGTCRSRFSNDSEDDSAVFSNSDDAGTEIHHILANKRRFMTSTDGTGDDGPRLARDIE